MEPSGEALGYPGGGDEDDAAGAPFGKQEPGGKRIDGTFREAGGMRRRAIDR